MGTPFSDITLYLPTPHKVGTPEFNAEASLQNYISDLYVQKMYGYKPPKTTRITIQPAFHDIWLKTWKTGSIISVAPKFDFDKYNSLDKSGKYKYILDIIHSTTLKLSEEFNWDKTVFENSYNEILKSNFAFKIEYPTKMSRDKKKIANLCIEKSETETFLYGIVNLNGSLIKTKLIEKKNTYWYDCIYLLAKNSKWLNNYRFGIWYDKGKIEISFSTEGESIEYYEAGNRVTSIDFIKYFNFG